MRMIPQAIAGGCRKILVASPTGTGKGRIIEDLVHWAAIKGMPTLVLTNRRMLLDQTESRFDTSNLEFGIRAAGHSVASIIPNQIAMVQTETSWRKTGRNGRHPARLVIVDEAHLNSNGKTLQMLTEYVDSGVPVVGFTATPLDLGHFYQHLLDVCSMEEGRYCGALVPAVTYAPCEPDLALIKRVKTSDEEKIDASKSVIWMQQVVGSIEKSLGKYNPNLEPTLIFCPCVASSLWLSEALSKRGIRSAHIDGGESWLDGEKATSEKRRWEIIDLFRSGEVKVICNRFVLREGIDVPEVRCIVSACVYGTLTTYLQTIGRGLRSAPGKTCLVHLDHGGNWWRHGDVNDNREWELKSTNRTERVQRYDALRESLIPEPICCPICGATRARGSKCPQCGFTGFGSQRRILQADGKLRIVTGRIFRPRDRTRSLLLSDKWNRMYHRARKAGMTFLQAEALLAKENDWQWPTRDFPLMPIEMIDWYRKVNDVDQSRLIPPKNKAAQATQRLF
jgi:superfamily II DNA or RNA helicase